VKARTLGKYSRNTSLCSQYGFSDAVQQACLLRRNASHLRISRGLDDKKVILDRGKIKLVGMKASSYDIDSGNSRRPKGRGVTSMYCSCIMKCPTRHSLLYHGRKNKNKSKSPLDMESAMPSPIYCQSYTLHIFHFSSNCIAKLDSDPSPHKDMDPQPLSIA